METTKDDIDRIILELRQNGSEERSHGVLKLRGVDLSGRDLSRLDLSGADLSGANLSGADLSLCNLEGAVLLRANLKGALLLKANLRNSELTGADLTGANLEEADAAHAGMGMAVLKNAVFFNANLEWGTLTKADVEGADFRAAVLKNARIREASLVRADLTNADMRSADLSLSDVDGAVFNNANLQESRLRLVRNFETASWIGVDVRNINFAGAYRLRRFISDQNYLKEFKESGSFARIVYFFWWLTSDCGRSMMRWFLWIGVQVLVFAFLYSKVGVDYGMYPTFLSPIYYSVVTLTTLGYGDVVPSTVWGQVVAMLEVTTGYLMLGGLISILSTKMTRRAD